MAVYAITLAFANSKILYQSVSAFHATRNPDLPLAGHVIVDQHYPLDHAGVKQTISDLASTYGEILMLDPGRNLGLHEGFNWAMRQLPLQDNDIVIGYDGDSLPITPGWDMALVRALEGRRSDGHGEVVWSTLGNPRTLRDLYERGFDEVKTDGYLRMLLTRTSITNSVCAWRYGWLKRVGFLHEPKAFYGHLEATMWGRLGSGRRWAVVPDWKESDELRLLHDRAYVVYKWRHSHVGDWPGDFKSFVEAGCPVVEPAPAELP